VCLLLIANVVILNTPLVSCYKLYESPFLVYFAEKSTLQFIFIIAYPFLWMISILPFRVFICYRMRYTF
jgi:hypothetical protein